ncbi:hypothetical protein H4219_005639 [Mycoemilia scoparia]|uniref:Uncharacterized protein n=1 Tax=Mycoemilia scoparia TaxID=417184 RepID=A0A9W7ZM45_9FUNG|nr:hypothetical protein H4219_005639 [Mycoemilia scoparia]
MKLVTLFFPTLALGAAISSRPGTIIESNQTPKDTNFNPINNNQQQQRISADLQELLLQPNVFSHENVAELQRRGFFDFFGSSGDDDENDKKVEEKKPEIKASDLFSFTDILPIVTNIASGNTVAAITQVGGLLSKLGGIPVGADIEKLVEDIPLIGPMLSKALKEVVGDFNIDIPTFFKIVKAISNHDLDFFKILDGVITKVNKVLKQGLIDYLDSLKEKGIMNVVSSGVGEVAKSLV